MVARQTRENKIRPEIVQTNKPYNLPPRHSTPDCTAGDAAVLALTPTAWGEVDALRRDAQPRCPKLPTHGCTHGHSKRPDALAAATTRNFCETFSFFRTLQISKKLFKKSGQAQSVCQSYRVECAKCWVGRVTHVAGVRTRYRCTVRTVVRTNELSPEMRGHRSQDVRMSRRRGPSQDRPVLRARVRRPSCFP